MVTAKKASTPKPVETVVAAPGKTVAAKKPAAKKSVAVATPVAAEPVVAPVAMPVVATPEKAKVPAKSKAKPKAAPAPVASVEETPTSVEESSPSAEETSTVVVAKAELSTEQRNNYVQVAAFYIAERRAFAPGNPADDWAAAEAEVDRLIASGQFGA